MNRKHPDANCEDCSLLNNGSFVPSKAPQDGRANGIAIIGEAPGYNEVDKREPFVGASGKLLNAVLSHSGVNRDETYLTNAVACRHPNGDNPTTEAIDACRPRLLKELQSAGIAKVLALGNPANESVLDKVGVTQLRVGRGRTSPYNDNIHVISSVHPASILRSPDTINLLTTDVGKLTTELPEWEAPKYFVVETEAQANQIFEELYAYAPQKITLDIETNIEKDVDFGQPNQTDLLCIGMCYDHNKVVVFSEEVCMIKSVMQALKKFVDTVPDVGYHNGKFDKKGMFPICGVLKQTFDTQLESYALNEYTGIHKPHSLEFIGRELLGAPDWKHALDRFNPKVNGYGVIPRPILYKYNAYDCAVTWDVDTIQRARIMVIHNKDIYERGNEWGLWDLHNFLIEISNELIFVEMNGIGIDKNHLAVLAKDFGDQMEGIHSLLDEMLPPMGEPNYQPKSAIKKATHPFNPSSPKQVKQILADFGANVSSTDENTLKFILQKRADKPVGIFAETLLRYRKIAKQKGTYVDGIEKRLYAGRVYTNFLLHGTTNGRLSSRNPNLQNIPRKKIIKDLFVVIKPENVLIQADYSQAELRILCWMSGDTYFTPIFNGTDRDVFDELTIDLFPHIDKATTSKEEWKDVRSRLVKPFVYGIGYGRTEYGIASDPDTNMTVSEAKTIMGKFTKLIPEIMEWQNWVKREVSSGRDLISPFGRHRRFPLITDDNRDDVMREALSFLPSSTSSDVGLRALCKVRKDLKGIGWVRNFVHDSILGECHESRQDEVKEILETRMIESGKELLGDYVKFAVDITTGKTWGECN